VVELTKWTRILARRSDKLPAHAFKAHDESTFFCTNKLRHTAVHRLATTARGITTLLQAAKDFTEALQDLDRAPRLEELHHVTGEQRKSYGTEQECAGGQREAMSSKRFVIKEKN
jgi:hypothetical protein